MYKYNLTGILLGVWLGLSIIIVWWLNPFQSSTYQAQWQAKNALMKRFLLTDYCLSTESRHTRHLSMPEWIAPFQDLPGFYEHFPSSSFLVAPRELKK
ncbi:MAG: hypothetical protein MUE85_20270 [Microscillaceae bacterium]|jgi:hypothetical protein|nr:hypothetical protein [Microscillaceae bacterium]